MGQGIKSTVKTQNNIESVCMRIRTRNISALMCSEKTDIRTERAHIYETYNIALLLSPLYIDGQQKS